MPSLQKSTYVSVVDDLAAYQLVYHATILNVMVNQCSSPPCLSEPQHKDVMQNRVEFGHYLDNDHEQQGSMGI